MKSLFYSLLIATAVWGFSMIPGCKKEYVTPVVTPPPPPPPPPPIVIDSTSFTEEFQDCSELLQKGWLIGEYSNNDSSGVSNWGQGMMGTGKTDTTWYGFSAFSYGASPDEYIYSYVDDMESNISLSAWLLTPVLTVKNGDKISFYTRGDTTRYFTDRMQVLLNKTGSEYIGHSQNSMGDFTTVMFDINANQSAGGYPTTWTKYEYTFSGFSGTVNIRVGFRHYVDHPIKARGVGIDQFKFERN